MAHLANVEPSYEATADASDHHDALAGPQLESPTVDVVPVP